MRGYQTDAEGYLVSQVELELDLLESKKLGREKFLVPGGVITVAPPKEVPVGQELKWNGTAWAKVESRESIKAKMEEGRVLVNGKWSEPKPSPDHVMENGVWVIPKEVEEGKAMFAAAREVIKNRKSAKTVDDLKEVIDALVLFMGLDRNP